MKQEFMNEIIAKQEEINGELIWSYFKYRNLSLLAKDLIRTFTNH